MTRRSRAELGWLIAALALHGLVFISAGRRAPSRQPRAPRDAPARSEWTVELETPEAPSVTPDVPLAPDTPAAPIEPSPAVTRTPASGSREPRIAQPSLAPHPGPARATDSATSERTAPANEEHSEPRANLSLDALGVGRTNPFLGASPNPEGATRSPRAVGESRFERSMAAEIARSNQSVGLGPEGPVLTALERAAREGNPEPNSTALFRCRTDAAGRLIGIDLVQSSSVPKPWNDVARRVAAALKRRVLRIPKTGYGLTFDIRVTSHVQMPSGADPGLAVSLLGIPLKEGDGPRSARVDLLDIVPHVEEATTTLPDGRVVHTPVLRLGKILGVQLDPADLGAKPQRMVRAHVERIQTNDAP